MQRLDRELHNPHKDPEDNYYSTPTSMCTSLLWPWLVLLTTVTLLTRDRRKKPDSIQIML